MAFREINQSEMLVLLALADRADSRYASALSHAQISSVIPVANRTVKRCMLVLDEMGYIERTSQRKKNGHRSVDRIFLACLKASFCESDRGSYRQSLSAKLAPCPEAKLAPPSYLLNKEKEGQAEECNLAGLRVINGGRS